ncbi:alkaline phosphatase [Natronococcus sp. JC468]|nr:alkaline phosphatase [Natronococcus sp. JC468]
MAVFSQGVPGSLEEHNGAAAQTTTDVSVPEPCGVQIGDVVGDRAIIWSRVDRPARMYIEIATDAGFENIRTIRGPAALSSTDYTVKLDLGGLPRGKQLYFRVIFESLAEPGVRSDPVTGSFRTPPEDQRDIRFLWGGDVAGQGWGIDQSRDGMTIFETMCGVDPDFFIHSGDAIYADGPLPEEIELDDGSVWNNLVVDEKAEVADTLDDFRGNYRYNFQDEHYRDFVAKVPMIAQWDDHEVTNNWYPGEILPEDDPHDVKSVDLLAARGQRAFMEYMPVRAQRDNRDEHYSTFPYGPSLEIFRLDLRSYRGPNTATLADEQSSDTAILGAEQLAWLKQSLADSDSTWKVIASDMPLGLVIPDGEYVEGIANEDGQPRGREFEIADLLSFLAEENITNLVWLTADVHYTAAHHYHPDRAQFTDFDPFWEFVSGPLHAGTFGPSELDNTFGPEVVFSKAPPEGEANLPPSAGLQFFGQVDIDGDSEILTVQLKDRDGTTLFTKELDPN